MEVFLRYAGSHELVVVIAAIKLVASKIATEGNGVLSKCWTRKRPARDLCCVALSRVSDDAREKKKKKNFVELFDWIIVSIHTFDGDV